MLQIQWQNISTSEQNMQIKILSTWNKLHKLIVSTEILEDIWLLSSFLYFRLIQTQQDSCNLILMKEKPGRRIFPSQ